MSNKLKIFLGISYLFILSAFLYLIFSNIQFNKLDDFSYYKYEFTEFLAYSDIDDKDRKYVENYLAIVNEISNQYETKYFEENGVHTEGYWFDYLKELITEE